MQPIINRMLRVNGCWGGSPRSVNPNMTVLHISSLLQVIQVLRSRHIGVQICRFFGEADAGVLQVVLLHLNGCILQTLDSVPDSASLSQIDRTLLRQMSLPLFWFLPSLMASDGPSSSW